MNYNELIERYKKVYPIDDVEKAILESLRLQDSDLSAKAGAILAFCGLMIATSIIQLSAAEGSHIYLSKGCFSWWINGIGLIALFIGSILCLRGLIFRHKYSTDPKEALVQFEQLITNRRMSNYFSVAFALLGSFFVLFSFFSSSFFYFS